MSTSTLDKLSSPQIYEYVLLYFILFCHSPHNSVSRDFTITGLPSSCPPGFGPVIGHPRKAIIFPKCYTSEKYSGASILQNVLQQYFSIQMICQVICIGLTFPVCQIANLVTFSLVYFKTRSLNLRIFIYPWL